MVEAEVYSVQSMKGSKVATVQLRVPLQQAAELLALTGEKVRIDTGGALAPLPSARPHVAIAAKDSASRVLDAAGEQPARKPRGLLEQVPDGWLTVSQFAAEHGVSANAVRGWIKSRLLRHPDRKKRCVRQTVVRGWRSPTMTVIWRGTTVNAPAIRRRKGALAYCIASQAMSGTAKALGRPVSTIEGWAGGAEPTIREREAIEELADQLAEDEAVALGNEPEEDS